jgi:hypothetical protein
MANKEEYIDTFEGQACFLMMRSFLRVFKDWLAASGLPKIKKDGLLISARKYAETYMNQEKAKYDKGPKYT